MLDVSGESEIFVSCRGRTEASVRLRYEADKSFPPNTRGVLYFVPTEQCRHIRFRLCDSVTDFSHGSDLLKSDGQKWTMSLKRMASGFRHYHPLLNMIMEENPSFAADIDTALSKRRIIRTLLPQELTAKGQRLFDISNLSSVQPQFSIQNNLSNSSYQIYYYRQHTYGQHASFPANTKGVFYYRQSTTAPNAIGELRFRLCSDVGLFTSGSDLCLPSGLPWCITSTQLLSMPSYSTVRGLLLHEGLFKRPLPPYADASTVPLICSLKQPFVMDLDHLHAILHFKIGADNLQNVKIYCLFGDRSETFYTGKRSWLRVNNVIH